MTVLSFWDFVSYKDKPQSPLPAPFTGNRSKDALIPKLLLDRAELIGKAKTPRLYRGKELSPRTWRESVPEAAVDRPRGSVTDRTNRSCAPVDVHNPNANRIRKEFYFDKVTNQHLPEVKEPMLRRTVFRKVPAVVVHHPATTSDVGEMGREHYERLPPVATKPCGDPVALAVPGPQPQVSLLPSQVRFTEHSASAPADHREIVYRKASIVLALDRSRSLRSLMHLVERENQSFDEEGLLREQERAERYRREDVRRRELHRLQVRTSGFSQKTKTTTMIP
eukprot:ANDGO_01847.mRNA.1 hypothetical protein